MLYQQASVIINCNFEGAWNILKKAMTSGEYIKIFPGCLSISDISENDGKVSRALHFENRIEQELNIVNFSNYRINSLLQNNPNYFAEVNFILLKPTEEFLSEKHTSLIIISAFRMHPGIFAAPTVDKQEYINGLALNLKVEAENSF